MPGHWGSSHTHIRPPEKNFIRAAAFHGNGRFVSGHDRTRPDGDFCNNWSTSGNCNPFTGERGCRSYPSFPSDGSRFRW
jgi:hypothetical protein